MDCPHIYKKKIRGVIEKKIVFGIGAFFVILRKNNIDIVNHHPRCRQLARGEVTKYAENVNNCVNNNLKFK